MRSMTRGRLLDEQENDFPNRLGDDILGLRDSVEVADWNHAAEIAREIRQYGQECGWPLVTQIADYLLHTLETRASRLPEDVIELHLDAFELCLAKNLKRTEGEGAKLVQAIEKLAAQNSDRPGEPSRQLH